MLKYIPNIINNISNILSSNEPYKQLGRWCHPGIPNCSQDVLLRKIDFANSDNNLCNKNKEIIYLNKKIVNNKLYTNNNIEPSTFTPQDYIDAMYN